jgi:hypothetical protein
MSFSLPSSGTLSAISSISGLVTGVGQLMGGQSAKSTGSYNASIYEQKANAERQSYKLLEAQKRKSVKSIIGTQISQTGASGFKFSGDPITIMNDSLYNAEMDMAIDRYNSEVTARSYENQANLERYQARQKAAAAGINAGTTFLSTAADIYKNQSTIKKPTLAEQKSNTKGLTFKLGDAPTSSYISGKAYR